MIKIQQIKKNNEITSYVFNYGLLDKLMLGTSIILKELDKTKNNIMLEEFLINKKNTLSGYNKKKQKNLINWIINNNNSNNTNNSSLELINIQHIEEINRLVDLSDMYEHDTINDIISDINKCEHYRDSICVRFNDMHYYKKIIVMMRNNYYIQMNSYQYIQFL